jgi:hypothetical protein
MTIDSISNASIWLENLYFFVLSTTFLIAIAWRKIARSQENQLKLKN